MNQLASGGFASGATVFVLAALGIAWTAFNIWLIVIAIQFGRAGTQAFRRYLAITEPQALRSNLAQDAQRQWEQSRRPEQTS